MEFEQVLFDPHSECEVEYMEEDEEVVKLSRANSPIESPTPEPVKRKVPIIRKPGEVVTPARVQPPSFSSKVPDKTNTPTSLSKPIITARVKPEWKKVDAPSKTLSLTPAAKNPKLPSPVVKTEERNSSVAKDAVRKIPVTSRQPAQSQLDRIERKMDDILSKLERHENIFRQIKASITDLNIEMKSTVTEVKSHFENKSVDTSSKLPAKRKRLVVFPVANDDYLDRLEELAGTDQDIQEDLIALYKSAPVNSVYDFLRHNIASLFKNCSKHTWTGKPSNSCPTSTPCNTAGNLTLVDLLITSATEIFPYAPRDIITKDFRRALRNFNDAEHKRPLRLLKKAMLEQQEEDETKADDE